MRLRKLALCIGAAALLAGGGAAFLPPLLWGDRADYSHVTSIGSTREYKDPLLLRKAWALPVAATYRASIDFQRNPSYCGPASLVNVLRSLQQAGDQATLLDEAGRWTLLGHLPGGVTLDELADIARTKLPRKTITVLRDLDLASFRAELRLANDPSRRYVINFARGPLFGAGHGHHSPLAGYLVDEDLVLVLDVNRDYGAWLVRSQRLHEAMNTHDRSAGQMRGLLRIE